MPHKESYTSFYKEKKQYTGIKYQDADSSLLLLLLLHIKSLWNKKYLKRERIFGIHYTEKLGMIISFC